MPNILKPSGLNQLWAAGGTKIDPGMAKINIGWVVELPPYQYQNWLDNKQDTFIAHTNQHGIPEWDTETEYQGNLSYTQGSNGIIYKCIQTHTNLDPVNPLNGAYWSQAFEPFGSVAVVQNALSAHLANYATLSGIANTVAARNNLSVYSKSEGDVRYAYKAGTNTQTFSVADATLPEHAVRYGQVLSLLVGATESVAGIIQIATSGEVSTGVNDTKAVTPLKLASQYLSKAGNLSGIANTATARANLGLGTAATADVGIFLQAANNLSDLANATIARTNLGLQSTATTAISAFLLKADNLAGLASPSAARANLGLGNSATLNVGTVAGTVAAGNDSRIVNAVQTSRTLTAGNGLTGGGNLGADRTFTLGTPGSISSTTANVVSSTSHTHAFDINSFFNNRQLSAEGYYTFPGGFLVQWGTVSVDGGGGGAPQSQTVALQIPFQSAVFGILLTYRNTTDSDGDSCHARSNGTLNSFFLANQGRANSVFWVAVGV